MHDSLDSSGCISFCIIVHWLTFSSCLGCDKEKEIGSFV